MKGRIVAQETNAVPFRRRFPRRRFQNSVGVLCRGKFEMVLGSEIGEGGLLFLSGETFPVGADVVANFFVPGRNFVTVRAQLIYAIPAKTGKNARLSYGVRFIGISFEAKRMIRDYIAEKTAIEANAV